MRVMAGRAILLFGLSEMLSKPQAGLTPARLKANRLWLTGHSCSFPWLSPARQAGPWAPHCCSQCREKQLSRANPAAPVSPELLWHTTGLQPKAAWPSCQHQDAAAAAACRAQAELCLQVLGEEAPAWHPWHGHT